MNKNKRIKEILERRVTNLGDKLVELDRTESEQYFQQLKVELKKAFKVALKDSSNFRHQLKIIFLEYDFIWGENDGEREAYLCGFGDGKAFNYPILEEREYLKYNYHDELFNGVGTIKYDIETDERTEFIDEENGIHISTCLKQIEIDQVNLFLHNAFDELQVEIFKEHKNLEDEIFVYGNLHDHPCSNLFVINKKS